MATEPIREQILEQIVTTFRGLDGTDPYWSTLVAVRRGKARPDDLSTLPRAYVTEGEETITPDMPSLDRTLLVQVEAWLRSSENDLPTLANRMLADLERILTADPTRGGLALETILVEDRIETDEDPGTLAAVVARFSVRYFTAYGDPSTQG